MDLKYIARHAATVLAGLLAVIAFGVTDTIVAGRYSETALAALSVGYAVFISVFVALTGVLQALLPVWAELHGAGRTADVGRSVRQSLYLCAATIAVGMAVLLAPDTLMRWTEVPPALQSEVKAYLDVLIWTLAPALLFRMFSTLNQSLGKPLLVTWLQLGALVLKVPLSVWFCFGGLGLAPGGAAGCAWASVVVNWATFLVALWLLRTQALYRPYELWRRMERPDWRQIGAFARLGVPGGLAVMVEVTSFTLMALFIARQGTVALAAHQIASNLAGVMYMMPLSIGIATSARVSYWLGAGEASRARAALRTGLRLVAAMGLLQAAILFTGREAIAGIYAHNPAVIAMGATLLAWVAFYHLADCIQAFTVFILRCYRVTVMPLVAYCVLLWGLGLAGGYVVAYEGVGGMPALNSPVAFWGTSMVALMLVAVILPLILWRALRSERHRG